PVRPLWRKGSVRSREAETAPCRRPYRLLVALLVVEFGFAVACLWAALGWALRRTEPGRSALPVFVAMAVLFAVDLARNLAGQPPEVVLELAAVLVFAQPYLTLRLIALLRPLPEWLAVAT